MLVNYILTFISVLLFAGLAIDFGVLEMRYLQIQGAAQAAANAAALVKRENQSWTWPTAGANAAAANGFTNGVGGATVTIQNPPTSGTYSGNSSAYLATVSQAVPTSFLGILGLGKFTLTAQALSVAGNYTMITSSFNVNAIYTDGTTVTNGGIDTANYSISATGMGHQFNGMSNGSRLSWHAQLFYTGAPNSFNGVANKTVPLTSGSYRQLLILATTGYGPYYNANFVVKYADNSTTTGTFNMSDWCYYSNFPGESIVVQTPYRLYSSVGASNDCQAKIYGYTINLDPTRTVSNVTLPSCRNVVILAMDVVP